MKRSSGTIVYDLTCENGHMFEGWFKDSGALADQRERKLIACPVCSSVSNEIVPLSLCISGKSGSFKRSSERRPKARSLPQAYDLIKDCIEHHFDDVGDRFADVAVNIHLGMEEERNIRGRATQNEEEYLKEEGIAFIKIPSVKLDS